jgi:simple sugar transport system permease protein
MRKSGINKFIADFGWPRIIIAIFLLLLFAVAPFADVDVGTSLSDMLVRVGMNGILVLAMVPMIQSGCGLNFGLPLGIIAGLVGAVSSMEYNWQGFLGFAMAIVFSVPLAVLLGMMIGTYVGFSAVAFMSMMWLRLPYKNPVLVWGFSGAGLRTTISLNAFWIKILDNAWALRIGNHFFFPTGAFIFFALCCLGVWAFFKTKTGIAMSAVGSNPQFARVHGVSVDRMRVISVVLSTVLGAVGMVVYEQSYGFVQLYMGPLYMAFPAVAAILLGGATINRATISNVVIGTFLFQGILTMTPSVINGMLKTDMAEVIRILVSNGMILYALTRKGKERKK